MADRQPSSVVEGATTGDVEDEVPPTAAAKSAEDRKAAAALSALDSAPDDDSATAAGSSRNNVDQEAVHKAIERLGSAAKGPVAGVSPTTTGVATSGNSATNLPIRKNIKIDSAHVALLVEQLDMNKIKATDFLRSHNGNVVQALTAYVAPSQ